MSLLQRHGRKVVCSHSIPDLFFVDVYVWDIERAKVRKAMEAMLLKAAMKIVTTVNREKDHIPPITTSEANPFPYQIVINPKGDGWGARMGIF